MFKRKHYSYRGHFPFFFVNSENWEEEVDRLQYTMYTIACHCSVCSERHWIKPLTALLQNDVWEEDMSVGQLCWVHKWTSSTRVLQTFTKTRKNTTLLVCHWFVLSLCWFFYCSLCMMQKDESNSDHVEQKLLNIMCNLLAEQHISHYKNQSIQSRFCKI